MSPVLVSGSKMMYQQKRKSLYLCAGQQRNGGGPFFFFACFLIFKYRKAFFFFSKHESKKKKTRVKRDKTEIKNFCRNQKKFFFSNFHFYYGYNNKKKKFYDYLFVLMEKRPGRTRLHPRFRKGGEETSVLFLGRMETGTYSPVPHPCVKALSRTSDGRIAADRKEKRAQGQEQVPFSPLQRGTEEFSFPSR